MTRHSLRAITGPALSGWSEHEIGIVGQPTTAEVEEES
jgi:hypothetical protein